MDGLFAFQASDLRVDDSALFQVERAPFVVPVEEKFAGFSGGRNELDDVGELELSKGSLEGHGESG